MAICGSVSGDGAVVELGRGSRNWIHVVEEIVRTEKKIFPKHESLAKSFDEELKKRNCGLLYYDIEGDVAGYVMYSWPSSLSASITKLAVKENYRRKGVGEALLKGAIKKCITRKVQCISLHVDPLRTAAVGLYKKYGFEVESFVERYYSPDRDAYRMHLQVNAQPQGKIAEEDTLYLPLNKAFICCIHFLQNPHPALSWNGRSRSKANIMPLNIIQSRINVAERCSS